MTEEYNNFQEEGETQYFCKFTFGQFFTILMLEVVTLAFVFYLGAKYGTNYLKIADDEKPEQQMITVAPPQEAVRPAAPAVQDAEVQAMARDVIETGRKEADLKERVKELLAKQQMKDAIPANPPASAPTAAAETVPAPIPKVEQAPIQMKSPAGSPYSVQVGSFPNMEEATSRVNDWRNKGYPSYMMIADIPDRGRWYRVRIGGFATKEDAQSYLEKIKQSEGTEGIVVLNEQ